MLDLFQYLRGIKILIDDNKAVQTSVNLLALDG